MFYNLITLQVMLKPHQMISNLLDNSICLFVFFFSVNQNVIETNLLKLAYNEMSVCSDASAATWSKILEKGNEPVDMKILVEAVKAGMNNNPS